MLKMRLRRNCMACIVVWITSSSQVVTTVGRNGFWRSFWKSIPASVFFRKGNFQIFLSHIWLIIHYMYFVIKNILVMVASVNTIWLHQTMSNYVSLWDMDTNTSAVQRYLRKWSFNHTQMTYSYIFLKVTLQHLINGVDKVCWEICLYNLLILWSLCQI